jgi:hypothetical protein
MCTSLRMHTIVTYGAFRVVVHEASDLCNAMRLEAMFGVGKLLGAGEGSYLVYKQSHSLSMLRPPLVSTLGSDYRGSELTCCRQRPLTTQVEYFGYLYQQPPYCLLSHL